MNWDPIEGSWKQVKGRRRNNRVRLTDDELDESAGKRGS